jgi:hypothetical protein
MSIIRRDRKDAVDLPLFCVMSWIVSFTSKILDTSASSCNSSWAFGPQSVHGPIATTLFTR